MVTASSNPVMKFVLLLPFLVSVLADCRTGKSLDGQVMGFPATTVTASPYVVSLQLRGKHYCSGAAIGSRYAVTTARCMARVNAAAVTLRSNTASSVSGGRIHAIERVTLHPGYDPATLANDIAVVKVTSSKKFLNTISLAKTTPLLSTATTFGWPLRTSILDPWVRNVNAPLKSSKTCVKSYGPLGESMLCAGLGSIIHCQGDAGSPLVASGKLIGLSSFGYGCSKARPGVYTNIPVLKKWIDQNS